MTISILLADDHPIVRKGLRALFEGDPRFVVVDEASDGLQTVRLVERLQPGVVVLDLMMPGLNGLEALPIIRRRAPATRVIVFSMYANEAWVAETLHFGAAAYVLKGGDTGELVTAIQEVMAGRRYLSPPLSESALRNYQERSKSVAIDPHSMLTPRQRQVFQLAAEGKTCREIAGQLFISERTVEMHRANVMHKLGLRSQTDLVLYAAQRGIFQRS